MRVAPRAVQDSRSSLSAKFTAAHRLLRQDGFDRVIRAENIPNRNFKIFFARNGKKNARLGIIVGKKTLSGAVGRNSVKRIIREAFRQHSIKQCKLDMVVMVRRAYSQGGGKQADNLKMLLSRLEKKYRCVEL